MSAVELDEILAVGVFQMNPENDKTNLGIADEIMPLMCSKRFREKDEISALVMTVVSLVSKSLFVPQKMKFGINNFV